MAEIREGYYRAPSGVSPIDREIEKLEGTYYKLSEVARKIGRSESSIRKLVRNQELAVPSKTLVIGRVHTYLFTPEDVKLISKHYKK